MAKSLRRIAALMALVCVCTTGRADVLPDPTRPSTDYFLPGDASNAKNADTDSGLRTIVIAPDHRSAVINGQQVPLGGKVGEDRLMAVCEDRVVLQGVDGKREVSLYPDVVIQGAGNRHCLTPATQQAAKAASVSRKKLKKIRPTPAGKAAKKKEKSCK